MKNKSSDRLARINSCTWWWRISVYIRSNKKSLEGFKQECDMNNKILLGQMLWCSELSRYCWHSRVAGPSRLPPSIITMCNCFIHTHTHTPYYNDSLSVYYLPTASINYLIFLYLSSFLIFWAIWKSNPICHILLSMNIFPFLLNT